MKDFKTFEQAENTAALATMYELVAKFTHKTITILVGVKLATGIKRLKQRLLF